MTQVDFYILKNAPPAKAEHFVCQLAEKAFKKGHKIHIHTADNLQTERMDTLMWTYKDLSFLPHAIADSEEATQTPIHISHNSDRASIKDVLINLKSEIPVFYEQFERVAEIVTGDPQQQQAARQRYRQYQQRGCTVISHEVSR
ncbi:MAG: DNA polymerase III subunit chi [Gammaproteobacteria bacterium]|nr:DNA polymerase III subunit chi [Gammaproteobacteria bacterium]